MATHEFYVNMTCEGCANSVKKVLEKEGVTNVVTDVSNKKVTVVSDLTSDQLLNELKKTGKDVRVWP